MTAIVEVRHFGRLSLPPNAAIAGGQLVVGVVVSSVDSAAIAGANAKNVLGVCLIDCDTAADIAGVTPLEAFPAEQLCSVGAHGEYPVTYAVGATIGTPLVAAANGQVSPYVASSSTFDEIIGYCTQTTLTGAVGNAYIGPR